MLLLLLLLLQLLVVLLLLLCLWLLLSMPAVFAFVAVGAPPLWLLWRYCCCLCPALCIAPNNNIDFPLTHESCTFTMIYPYKVCSISLLRVPSIPEKTTSTIPGEMRSVMVFIPQFSWGYVPHENHINVPHQDYMPNDIPIWLVVWNIFYFPIYWE